MQQLQDQSGESGRYGCFDGCFDTPISGALTVIMMSSVCSNVTLECKIRGGKPRPEISWFKGTKELVDTSKYTLLNKGESQVKFRFFDIRIRE